LTQQKQKLIVKNVRKAEKSAIQRKVAVTQNDGFRVLTKEAELENLITKEEKEKEVKDYKTMKNKIKNEKKKRKCLKKTLKRRKKETDLLLEKRQGENEIKEIKDEVKLEVEIKRNQMKRKINDLKKRARRRKAAMETQLNRIRAKMANDIMKANKSGDMQLCRKGKKNGGKRDTYCNTNFIDDYIKNYDCKDKETFCYMCCENEFGNNFIDKRDTCYDMCDGKLSAKKAKKKSKKVAMAGKAAEKTKQRKLPELSGWVWRKEIDKKKSKK